MENWENMVVRFYRVCRLGDFLGNLNEIRHEGLTGGGGELRGTFVCKRPFFQTFAGGKGGGAFFSIRESTNVGSQKGVVA